MQDHHKPLFKWVSGLHCQYPGYGSYLWFWQGLGKEVKVASPFLLGCVQG